jgi:uncharacterized protein YcfL
MKYLLPILLCVLLLIGCEAKPIAKIVSDNPEVPYDYLFTIKEENIRVYRFMDAGSSKYIAVRGDEIQVIFDTKVGKATVTDQIQTIDKRELTPK